MKIKNLIDWQKELNICIRCGYCYEHCHLFKLFGWESDTPRGKLSLLYGLLTGEVEPSQHLTEKIFECFYCKNCSKACPAKVSPTDILTAAKADLVAAGFDAKGTTATVNEDLCGTCGICVSVCKPEALSMDRDNKKVLVDNVKCEGCGVCVAACPSGAMSQEEGFEVSKKELSGKVTDLLNTDLKVITFCCDWSVYPGLRLSQVDRAATSCQVNSKQTGIIVNMCSGRIDPELLLNAFQQGAWGILIACCPLGECEHDGNYKIMRRIFLLKNLLKQLGAEPQRLCLEWVSTGESQKLNQAIDRFTDKIMKLGPIQQSAHSSLQLSTR